MATTTGLGLIVTMALLLGCIGGGPIVVAPGVTVELICTGPDVAWYLNGMQAFTNEGCYRSALRSAGDRNVTAILAINGNNTCDVFKVYCRIYRASQFLYIHNTTLIVQGRLPSPESVHVSELTNSSTIHWKSPYSSWNSDIINVDPHITQYTVYITDNYTGNSIVNVNVTETQFTFTASENGLCPMYQVSAWNAGGEGELSETVQERIPQKMATGNVVTYITASQVLHILLQVTEPCKTRTPEYFIIAVMNSGRTVKTTTIEYDHQLGSQLAIRIELPQNVDTCSLHVNISAGNSAGMSLPTEIEVECPTVSTESTSATSFGSDAIPSVVTGAVSSVVTEAKQGDNITTIGITIAVIAVIGIVLIVAATFGIIWCRKVHIKDGLKKSEIEMKPNQAYETVTRAQPATKIHTEPCSAYGIAAHATQVHNEPDYEDVVQVHH